MNKIFVLTLVITLVVSQTVVQAKDAILTDYEFIRGKSHDYHFGFNSTDGTSRREEGASDAGNSLAINGNVSWVAQDGSTYLMYFRADKKGFRPTIKWISGP